MSMRREEEEVGLGLRAEETLETEDLCGRLCGGRPFLDITGYTD